MKKTYQGSCHCGAVRFEADLDLPKGTFKCNCSVLHHRFCTKCGVRPFSQGDGQLAVRVNCLDNVDPQELIDAPVKYFNMRHDDMKSPPAETRHL
jgi:hypothetical protein